MKNIVLSLFICITTLCNAQENNYQVDGNRIIITKVIDNLDANSNELYKRVKSYINRMHGGSNFELLEFNENTGVIIVKDLFYDLAKVPLTTWELEAFYTIRVDVKDNRIRIMCSAFSIRGIYKGTEAVAYYNPEYIIAQYYPITDKSSSWAYNKIQKKAFTLLIENMNNTILNLQNAISTKQNLSIEYAEW